MIEKMTIEQILKSFKAPPAEYSAAPFWFWNDDLKEENLLFQMREMKAKGIDEAIIHSRKGRIVEYLSEEWFSRVAFCLKNAKNIGLKVWIYDEDNWPSGYAGERVMKENPDFIAKHLIRVKGEDLPDGAKAVHKDREYTYAICKTLWNPAYSQSFYTDLLNIEATRCFIKHTHEEYYKRFKRYFGDGTIRGFFVDEPGFYNNFNYYENRADAGSVPFTDTFPEYFLNKRGYDVFTRIGGLWSPDGTALDFKTDFYDTLAEMYCENFMLPIKHFCNERGVLSIGHAHSEEFMPYHLSTQGDLFKVLSCLDYSGIDRIDVSAEKLTEKYCSSAAHIYGQKRAMSETFAASGLDLNPERIKQWTNFQYVRGINMMVPHAFFSSTDGDRKWECPPSLFYQNPYWKYFGEYAGYVKRLSYLFSQGSPNAAAALYYPLATITDMMTPDGFTRASEYDKRFIDVGCRLLERQIDFDIINDSALVGSTGEKMLKADCGGYNCIILPFITAIPYETLLKITRFAEAGGAVIELGGGEISCAGKPGKDNFAQTLTELRSCKNYRLIGSFWANVTGGNSSGSYAVHKYGGHTPKYFEWLIDKWIWCADSQPMLDWYKTLIVNHPMTADGFPWSYHNNPAWVVFLDYPGYDVHYHFDDLFRYVNAIADICAWEGSTDFLSRTDGTMAQFPAPEWGIPQSYKDVSNGMTVAEKYEKLMGYILNALGGSNGFIVIDNGFNTGKLYSAASNYFDNLCYGYESAYENMLFYRTLNKARGLEIMRGNAEKAAYYENLAKTVKEKYKYFWDAEKGRYINTVDIDGIRHDFGITTQNLMAIAYGLADAQESKSILDWLDGSREVAGDTVTGKDKNGVPTAYYYGAAPRTNTVAIESVTGTIGTGEFGDEVRTVYWNTSTYWPNYDTKGVPRRGDISCIDAANNAGFDRIQVNGGILFWTSYYDVMARIRAASAENGAKRMDGIAAEYQKDRLLRKPNGWLLGIIGEFPESGIVPMAYLHGFLGINADERGLVIEPSLPYEYDYAGVERLNYKGKVQTIEVERNGSVIITAEDGIDGKYVIKAPKGITVREYDEADNVISEKKIAASGEYSYFDAASYKNSSEIKIKIIKEV